MMGYFSNLELSETENYTDRSYRSFESQLLSRYEALTEKLRVLSKNGAPTFGDDFFSETDYLYAPLDCFKTTYDLRLAIEAAKKVLEEDYGILPSNESDREADINEDENQNQISLFEVVLLPSWFQTALAA